MHISNTGEWLPFVFAGLIGLSMLIYAILDGYDLGVGILMPMASDTEKDRMVASIGPFWDANETWLVLGVGLLLVAFPTAYSVLLKELYLPFTIMIVSLMLRGIAFDFRTKAKINHKQAWNNAFFGGSLMMSFTQGYILGSYILGFSHEWQAYLFSVLVGIGVVAAYSLIGSAWLILKTEADLQRKAVYWSRLSLYAAISAVILVSILTPLVSSRILHTWFSFPNIMILSPILLITLILMIALEVILRQLPASNDRACWLPFVIVAVIFLLCFHGLAYSIYPYIIPDKILISATPTSKESFTIMLVGAIIVLPLLFAYTLFAYKVFHGKARHLTYN